MWTPAFTNWFPGMTPDAMKHLSCSQIMASYRFIASNQPQD